MPSQNKNRGVKPDRGAEWHAWNESNQLPVLSPEQIVEWLDQHREMMFEIWRSNPGFRRQWEILNDWHRESMAN